MARKSVWVIVACGALVAQAVAADSGCTIRQITELDSGGRGVYNPDASRGTVAFGSDLDLVGRNEDLSDEVFLYNGSTITQITDAVDASLAGGPQVDRRWIAFASWGDLTGDNPNGGPEVFLYDGSGMVQVTRDGFRTFSLDAGRVAFASHFGGAFVFDGGQTTQVTAVDLGLDSMSLDGSAIAFDSSWDVTGENPDGSQEIFLLEDGIIRQITNSPAFDRDSEFPSMHGGWIAFSSTANLTGRNRDASEEIYLYDGNAIIQVTDASPPYDSRWPSLDEGRIAFVSEANLTGENGDHNWEVFLYDGSKVIQVTRSSGSTLQEMPSLDGPWIAFPSRADLTGENPFSRIQVFLANCPPIHRPVPTSTRRSSQDSSSKCSSLRGARSSGVTKSTSASARLCA